MKVKFKVALPKGKKNDLPLLKEVLSKEGFVNLIPGCVNNVQNLHLLPCLGLVTILMDLYLSKVTGLDVL